jgi:hypothetical protein
MIDIHRYRTLKPIIKSIPEEKNGKLEKIQEDVLGGYYKAEKIRRVTFEGAESVRQAAQDTLRFSLNSRSLEEQEGDLENITHALKANSSFVQVHASFSNGLFEAWGILRSISSQLTIPKIESIEGDSGESLSSRERLADMSVEYQLNGHAVGLFADACGELSSFRYKLNEMAQYILRSMGSWSESRDERLALEVMR